MDGKENSVLNEVIFIYVYVQKFSSITVLREPSNLRNRLIIHKSLEVINKKWIPIDQPDVEYSFLQCPVLSFRKSQTVSIEHAEKSGFN